MRSWKLGAVLAIALAACGSKTTKDTGSLSLSISGLSAGATSGSGQTLTTGRAATTTAPDAATRVVSVVLTHTGPDGGGTQTFRTIVNPITQLYNALPIGRYTFSATAYDGNGVALFASGNVTVEVHKNRASGVNLVLQQIVAPGTVGNGSPLIGSIVVSDVSPATGETIDLTANVTDSSAGQLTYRWTSACSGQLVKNGEAMGPGAGEVFSNATGKATSFTSYCTADETITFSVTQSDDAGGRTAATSFTLHYAAQGVDFTICFNSFPDILGITTAEPARNTQPPFGGKVNLVAAAQDADGDVMTAAWKDNCGGHFDNPASLTPVWTAPQAPLGTKPSTSPLECRLTLGLTDGRGGKNTGWLMVHVGQATIQAVARRFAVPRFAFVTSVGGTIASYSIDANTGALTAVGTPAATGAGPFGVAVTPSGKFAYVANSWDSTVSAYAVDATGALTAVGTPLATGDGPVAVAVDPSGKFAYVANKWASNIEAFTIDTATGALTSAGIVDVLGSPYPWGGGNDPGMPEALLVDPSGRFLLAAGMNTISSFDIDPVTGALTSAGPPVDAGSGDNYLASDPTGRFVYVAGLNSQSVRVFAIDAATGALTSAGAPLATGRNPSSVAAEPSGRFVYVTSSVDNTVSAYIVAPSGALVSLGAPVATGQAPVSISVDPSGKFAYVAANGAGVVVHTIDPASGALSAGTSAATGHSLLALTISGAIPPPFVYAVNNGANGTVSTFTIDEGTGALASAGAPVAAGQYPENLAVDPLGRFLYVPDPGGNAVTAYAINPATGALTMLGSTPATAPGDIAVHTSGRFVYVLNSANKKQSVGVYSVNASTGALAPVANVSVGLPVGIRIDPSGRFLYVAKDNGWGIAAYAIDPTTGTPTLVSSLGTLQATNIAVDPFGRFLFSCAWGAPSGFINAYAIDAVTGALTFVGEFTTGNYPYIAVDPTGRFVYASATTDFSNVPGSKILAHAIDAGTGVLTRAGMTDLTTPPGRIGFDPSGQFLLMAVGQSNSVLTFAMDAITGALTNVGQAAAGGNPVGIAATPGRAPWAAFAASSATEAPQFTLSALTSVSLQPGDTVELAAAPENTTPAQDPARWTYSWSDGGVIKGTFAPKTSGDGSDVVYTSSDCSLIGSYSTRGDHVIDLSVVVTDSITLESSAMVLPVVLHCPTNAYTIYGAVSGPQTAGVTLTLSKDGQVLMTVVSWDGFTKGYYAFGQSPETGLSPGTYTVTPSLAGYVFDPPSRTVTVYDAHTGNQNFTEISGVSYTLGGTITGYVGSGLLLATSGEPDLGVPANATTFTFGVGLATGAPYDVLVKASSPGQSCGVTSGGKGTIASANVTNVAVTCTTNATPTHTVGGSVTGLSGTIVLTNNGGGEITKTADGSFTFATPVAEGALYDVEVKTKPDSQTCTVTGGKDTMGTADVANVAVKCTTNSTDSAFGQVCTVAVGCTGEFNVCQNFPNPDPNYYGCTKACLVAGDCPAGSQGQKCNGQMLCRP